MKKLLILIPLINGCSTYSLMSEMTNRQPQVKPVEVVSVAKRTPIYHPPLPEPIDTPPVEWVILNPDTMGEYIKKVEAGEEPRVAYYGLTSQGYENLSMTMGEITRYLEQILHIVDYYRDIDEDDEENKEE
tara:strand:- start:10215 stop:10607 length:393 start_codon:yes stop_codon:yes gene_type:complete